MSRLLYILLSYEQRLPKAAGVVFVIYILCTPAESSSNNRS